MALETVTIDVDDQVTAAIEEVNVEIRSADLRTIIFAGVTDTAGQLQVSIDPVVDPASYKVLLEKSLAAFDNPYDITVADTGGVTPQTFVLVGSILPITPPARPALCRVFGFLSNAEGSVSEDAPVIVSAVGSRAHLSYIAEGTGSAINTESHGIAREARTVRPDPVTGIWEISLARGATVMLRIPTQGVDMLFTVPELASANLKDIRPVTTGKFAGAAFGAFSPFETPT